MEFVPAGPTTYDITNADSSPIKFQVDGKDVTAAAKDATVSVVSTDPSQTVDSIAVAPTNSESSTTVTPSGTTFTMPEEAVTVTATMKEASDADKVDDAKAAIQAILTAKATQAQADWDPRSGDDAKKDIEGWIASAQGAATAAVTVSSFTAATAGNKGTPAGQSGTVAYSIALSLNEANDTITGTLTITPTAYVPKKAIVHAFDSELNNILKVDTVDKTNVLYSGGGKTSDNITLATDNWGSSDNGKWSIKGSAGGKVSIVKLNSAGKTLSVTAPDNGTLTLVLGGSKVSTNVPVYAGETLMNPSPFAGATVGVCPITFDVTKDTVYKVGGGTSGYDVYVHALVFLPDDATECTHTSKTKIEEVAPTCSEAGYTTYYCNNITCFDEFKEAGDAATGVHEFDATTGKCATCDLTKVKTITVAGPSNEGERTEVNLTSDLTADVTRQMTATVDPTTATNAASLTWKLTDKGGNALSGDAATDVTIAQDGSEPLKATVTVKRTAKSGEYKVVATIDDSQNGVGQATVSGARDLIVNALTVDSVAIKDVTGGAKTVAYGDELTLAADVSFVDNGVRPTADDQKVTWTSTDTSVATVAADGKVTILKKGTTNITAASVKDPNKNDTLALTVNEGVITMALKTKNKTVSSTGEEVYLKVGQPGDTEGAVKALPADAQDAVTVTITKEDGTALDSGSTAKVEKLDAVVADPNTPMSWNYKVTLPANESETDAVKYKVTATFSGVTDKWTAASSNPDDSVIYTVSAKGAKGIKALTQVGTGGRIEAKSGDTGLELYVDAVVEVDGVEKTDLNSDLVFAWSFKAKDADAFTPLEGNVESDCTISGHEGHRQSTYTIPTVTTASAGIYQVVISGTESSGIAAEQNETLTITVVVEKADGPAAPTTAAFEAATMTLSGVADAMEYSLDGGATWTAVAAGATTAILDAAKVNQADGIQVRVKETAEVKASAAQTIALTRAGAPTLRGEDKAIVITNVNGSYTYEIKSGEGSWAAATVTGGKITGLDNGTSYSVRVAAKGTVLVSEAASATPSEPKATAEEKTELKAVIDQATADKKDVVVGANAAQVEEGTQFVPQAEMDALTAKLAAANTAYGDANATKSAVATAKSELETALTAFNAAKQEGTKTYDAKFYAPTDLKAADIDTTSSTNPAWGVDKALIKDGTTYGGFFTIKGTGTMARSWDTDHYGSVETYKKMGSYVTFTIPAGKTATLVVLASSNGAEAKNVSDVRLTKGEIAGTAVAEKSGATTVLKNEMTELTYEKLAEGTYYFGSPADGSNTGRGVRIQAMYVTYDGGTTTEPTKYTVTVTDGAADKSEAEKGESVKVTATVPTGKAFDKWTATGITLTADQAAANPLTFTMPEGNVSLTASFKDAGGGESVDKTYTITVDTATNGTVRADKREAKMGETVTVTATPAAGYELDAITVKTASNKSVTVTNGKFTMPGENVTVSATFKTLTLAEGEYAITCDTNLVGGAVSADKAKAKAGDTVTVTATPDQGYELDAITVKTVSGKSVTVTGGKFTMPGEGVKVSATFKKTGGEPKPPATTVDKTAFDAALAAAKAIDMDAVKTSKDGKDVLTSQTWVTQAVKDALAKAIADAESVKADATQDEIDALTKALEDATKAWAPTAGTKTQSTVPGAANRPSGGAATNTPSTSTGANPAGGKTTVKKDAQGNVTITATDDKGEVIAEVKLPATIPALTTKFKDVPEGHWAEKSINNMAALGLVKGVAAETYDMVSPVTRGSVATILSRLANGKADAKDVFSDVAEGQWFAEGVAWAAKAGVVTGFENGTFQPDSSITREQLAVMLCRYAKLLGLDVTAANSELAIFEDADAIQSWALEGMAWCVKAGIINGRGDGTVDPSANASRAEAAAMLARLVDLLK